VGAVDVFWASPSETLAVDISGFVKSCCCSGVNRGGGCGIDLFASGIPPAIEVSGTPKLRGGRSVFRVDG